MSKKTVIILIVVAALLVLGYFLFYKSKEQVDTSTSQTEITQPAESGQPADKSAGDSEGTPDTTEETPSE